MDNSDVGSGYNNDYDNAVGYGAHVHNNYYEPENYYDVHNGLGINNDNSDGDDGIAAGDKVANWYNGHPVVHLSRPAHAKPRPLNRKITLNIKSLTTLAAIKVGLIKLKVLAALKFFVLMIIKLKVIALVTFFLFVKFTIISKLLKLFVLPFVPNLFTWLRNIMMMQMNPMMPMMPMMPNDTGNNFNAVQLRNMSVANSVTNKRSATTNTYNINRFIASVQSAKCVEQMACRTAWTVPRIFQSVLFYW